MPFECPSIKWTSNFDKSDQILDSFEHPWTPKISLLAAKYFLVKKDKKNREGKKVKKKNDKMLVNVLTLWEVTPQSFLKVEWLK